MPSLCTLNSVWVDLRVFRPFAGRTVVRNAKAKKVCLSNIFKNKGIYKIAICGANAIRNSIAPIVKIKFKININIK